MKRTFKYALTVVLASALAGIAAAQSANFPDVPENHWAYEALARMKKEGLLMGYPDGKYIGSRPATRYELAVAMHAVWINLKTVTDGLETQIKTLEDKVNGMSGGATSTDIANLKAAVDQLKADVAGMQGWGADIAALKKASSTFEAEFKSMGVDIESMKKTLADYGDRITVLEKNQLPFTISGDLNFVGLGGYSQSQNYGIDSGGRLTGVSHNTGGGPVYPVGATKDLTILHELALDFKSRENAPGPQWGATAVIGDTTGGAFGNESTTPFGGYSEGLETLNISSAWVKFNTSLASLNFSATVGRQGEKISPLIYQRPDTVKDFYSNDRWENGEWTFDGVNVAFGVGPAKISVFGGKTGNLLGTGGNQEVGGGVLQPLSAGQTASLLEKATANPNLGLLAGYQGGAVPIDQQLGVVANLPIGDKGGIDLAYLWLNSDVYNTAKVGAQPDGVHVYGADIKFKADGFGLMGSYAKSQVYQGGSQIHEYDANGTDEAKKSDAWMLGVGKDFGAFGVKVGYEDIAPLFGAPGDWGTVGTIGDLTDVKGFNADVHFDATPNLSIFGKGQWLTGTGDLGTGFGFQTNDKVDTYKVGLGYKTSAATDVSLSYETAELNLKSVNAGLTGKPYMHWYNIGFGWNVSDNAKLKFLWQISDADLKTANGNGVYKGGVIATQFSVKF